MTCPKSRFPDTHWVIALTTSLRATSPQGGLLLFIVHGPDKVVDVEPVDKVVVVVVVDGPLVEVDELVVVEPSVVEDEGDMVVEDVVAGR